MKRALPVPLVIGLTLFISTTAFADWPMCRADAGRTGYTAESLPDALSLTWTRTSRHAPRRAWPKRQRIQFDRVYEPVLTGDLLFYGSSVSDKVYAVDAETGQTRWAFLTDGPVRFAPAIWRDRLFVASDDGHLYCLRAADGHLLWKLRGGPYDERLPGNDRIISRWPARGGPVVVDDTVYFAAGVWPSEGIYVYAVNVANGEVLWCNDSSGTIEMSKPRGGTAKSGVSAQGYLAAQGKTLIVPTGRGVPAAFERTSGEFHYFLHAENKANGGSDVTLFDDFFIFRNNYPGVGQRIAALADGVAVDGLSGTLAVATPKMLLYMDGQRRIQGRHRSGGKRTVTDRRGKEVAYDTPGDECWRVDAPHPVDAGLAVAGDQIIAGGDGVVSVIDIPSKEVLFTAEVDGRAHGLAVCNGRLIVSTNKGTFYCFHGQGTPEPKTITAWSAGEAVGAKSSHADAVGEILRATNVRRGYCLDLGCGDGRLAIELAQRTDLRIYAIDSDPTMVKIARETVDAAGLYGDRISVHLADPADPPLADRLFDLVVSGRSVTQGKGVAATEIVRHMMSPFLGKACLGKPGKMVAFHRGPLEGAGNWTHFYTDAGNSYCTDDSLLKGPLEALWYGDTDWEMPSRHAMSPASLVCDGRFIMPGMDGIRVVNAFNGRTIWEHRIPGMLAGYNEGYNVRRRSIGSNTCVADGRVYIRYANRCACLDLADGRVIGQWPAPKPGGSDGEAWWAYLACADGVLLGSLAEDDHHVTGFSEEPKLSRLYTESKLLFAMDASTGQLRWKLQPKHAIHNNAIALSTGRVYVIDRPLAKIDDMRFDPEKRLEAQAKEAAQKNGTEWKDEYQALIHQPPGRLIAFDANSGKIVWEIDGVSGSLLAISTEHNALVMSNEPASGLHADRGGQLTVFRADTGEKLWETGAGSSRPMLNGDKIVLPGHMFDLLTGQRSSYRIHGKSFTCGPIISSTHLMVFRSATFGYCNFAEETTVENYGGMRIGCWVDATPAGGLVLIADGAANCGCSYLNQATIALQPTSHRRTN